MCLSLVIFLSFTRCKKNLTRFKQLKHQNFCFYLKFISSLIDYPTFPLSVIIFTLPLYLMSSEISRYVQWSQFANNSTACLHEQANKNTLLFFHVSYVWLCSQREVCVKIQFIGLRLLFFAIVTNYPLKLTH